MNFQSLAVLLSVSVLSFQSPAFGDGHPYNGPTLDGDSIPVHLEHGIRVRDVQAAIKQCLIGADTEGFLGLVPKFKKKLGSQWKECWLNFVPGTFDISSGKCKNLSDETYFSTTRWENYEPEHVEIPPSDKFMGYLRFTLKHQSFASTVYIRTKAELPSFRYDAEVPDTSFDEVGNPDKNYMIVKGLRLSLPKDYEPNMSFINVRKGAQNPTLTISFKDYVSCLQSEIQKQPAAE